MKVLQQLWDTKLQLLPVVFALLLGEIPGIVRHLKRLYYVPVYFSIFPLRELNRDLAIYFGDDCFLGNAETMSSQDVEMLERRINRVAIVSMAPTVVVTPSIAGFASAFFLPTDAFSGFCFLFVLYKLSGLVHAAIGFGSHGLATKKTMFLFWTVYVIYFGCFLTVFETAYNWAEPFVAARDWPGLWKELRTILFVKIAVVGFVVALVAGVATNAITDRKLRAQLRAKKKTS